MTAATTPSALLGLRLRAQAPASSANLGPGFDCLGLALDVRDEFDLVVVARPGVRVASTGQGAESLPGDESHLVARAMLAGLTAAGLPELASGVGLELTCRNTIAHGRGMGSSSAAIVGGIMLARGLAGAAGADPLSQEAVVGTACAMEGHPDNVAAAALGGCTIAWTDRQGYGRAVRQPVHPDIQPLVAVPALQCATHTARKLLPALVPHADAAFNSGRTGLLVHALRERPDLLVPATADRLHEDYRRSAYPRSWELVQRMRAAGFAASISGAGPSVLVLAEDRQRAAQADAVLAGLLSEEAAFSVLRPAVGGPATVAQLS